MADADIVDYGSKDSATTIEDLLGKELGGCSAGTNSVVSDPIGGGGGTFVKSGTYECINIDATTAGFSWSYSFDYTISRSANGVLYFSDVRNVRATVKGKDVELAMIYSYWSSNVISCTYRFNQLLKPTSVEIIANIRYYYVSKYDQSIYNFIEASTSTVNVNQCL